MPNNENSLKAVDAKITALESEIAKLDELNARKVSITAAIAELGNDEQRALANDNDETAVKALVSVRAYRDVHGARLADVTAKIASQQKTVISVGRLDRQVASATAQLLAQHRLAGAVSLVQETFVGNPMGDANHLARHSKSFQAAERLAASFGAYHDDVNETASLRQLRAHFEPVVEAVNNEPEFQLSLPEAWLA